MELIHTFDVPAPPERAFTVLRDIERIGPCMPGASIDEVDGDHFTGRVKVKLGPIQVTYRGEADYVDVDPDALTATINAKGRESRGSGTANAVVKAAVTPGPDGGATVRVVTELAITGKPAQFGRSVMNDVGAKLIGQFADCLAGKLADDAPEDGDGESVETDPASTEPSAAPAGGGAAPETNGSAAGVASVVDKDRRPPASASAPKSEPEAIDLLEVAGAPVAQRLLPVAAAIAVLWILLRALRRR